MQRTQFYALCFYFPLPSQAAQALVGYSSNCDPSFTFRQATHLSLPQELLLWPQLISFFNQAQLHSFIILNPHQQLGGFFVLVSVATPSVQTVANQFKMWECLCCYRARSLTISITQSKIECSVSSRVCSSGNLWSGLLGLTAPPVKAPLFPPPQSYSDNPASNSGCAYQS